MVVGGGGPLAHFGPRFYSGRCRPQICWFPLLFSGLCISVGNLPGPEEIPGQLDDRVHSGRLHEGEEERGGQSLESSGQWHG